MNRLPWIIATVGVVSLLGCSPKKQRPAQPPSEQSERPARPGLQMHAELGVLDEGKVRTTFEKVWRGPMTDCQKRASGFVSGDTRIKMRVNHSGKVKWAYFAESNLGDHEAESCMMKAIKDATWPIPQGGEDGLVEQALPFADLADRPAVSWTPDRIDKVLDDAREDIGKCVGGASGAFSVTVIVAKSGDAVSAGVAQPDENADEAAECLAKLFAGLSYPRPGSWPAKVTVQVP